MSSLQEMVRSTAAELAELQMMEAQVRERREAFRAALAFQLQQLTQANCPSSVDLENGQTFSIAEEWWDFQDLTMAISLTPTVTKLSDLQ
jgi:hypothetical protein